MAVPEAEPMASICRSSNTESESLAGAKIGITAPRARLTLMKDTHLSLQQSLELFPFQDETAGISDDGKPADLTAPGDCPTDRQCIVRFPKDVAREVHKCILQTGAGTSAPLLDLRLQPSSQMSRKWNVWAFGEVLQGTLVDLPCHIESHTPLPQQGQDDAPSRVAYKSADVSQMLVVHRGRELRGFLNRGTHLWRSGLTPGTRRIRTRKFNRKPSADSGYVPEKVREAMQAIHDRMDNEPYTYEVYTEVDETVIQDILRDHAGEIYKPPPVRSLADFLRSGNQTNSNDRSESHRTASGASSRMVMASLVASAAHNSDSRRRASDGSSAISMNSAGSGSIPIGSRPASVPSVPLRTSKRARESLFSDSKNDSTVAAAQVDSSSFVSAPAAVEDSEPTRPQARRRLKIG
eukprot:gnl/TRDRNA2_/TRDRNA2_174813_c0_seq2.p1 gnl/TRDRNA2_/TRDRNA2_174813_c0~~gnl/TRDRNA2_/TRDRNA2_174813_c0_seq2.p1  ORF type:complete len:408 (+),score=35.27 gnl/TRDRNA2_/TRDRNA2_174813_c0_seq2:75-1298(+)